MIIKPLHLKLAGLHSFQQEQQVDFTMLGAAGVFGIFGPTGSGKSTVLDAITLALYGKVERAKGGIRGIINQHEQKMMVEFNFSVGEREFTAGRIYKKNKDGQTQLSTCRLLENTGGLALVLAEKSRDIDKTIAELIGLTVDDFTRAVVLPQGKFAEFLMLQGRERRLMLQRLFGLEKYGEKLMQKTKNRLMESQNEINIASSEQRGLGDASKKAVDTVAKNLQEQEKHLKKNKSKLQSKPTTTRAVPKNPPVATRIVSGTG
ncbi:MAG: SMC family ATPase [Desulfotomaculum sp.]|nr:SMC family ATPase [Desulfotomaculum sp.]